MFCTLHSHPPHNPSFAAFCSGLPVFVSRAVRRKTIDSAAINEGALEIFRALRLRTEVLEEAGLMQVAFAPSDDELD